MAWHRDQNGTHHTRRAGRNTLEFNPGPSTRDTARSVASGFGRRHILVHCTEGTPSPRRLNFYGAFKRGKIARKLRGEQSLCGHSSGWPGARASYSCSRRSFTRNARLDWLRVAPGGTRSCSRWRA